jgi:hypothetical protein
VTPEERYKARQRQAAAQGPSRATRRRRERAEAREAGKPVGLRTVKGRRRWCRQLLVDQAEERAGERASADLRAQAALHRLHQAKRGGGGASGAGRPVHAIGVREAARQARRRIHQLSRGGPGTLRPAQDGTVPSTPPGSPPVSMPPADRGQREASPPPPAPAAGGDPEAA